MTVRQRFREEPGETLIELIVAITILGVCVVAIGAGITVSIMISDIQRDQATAGAYVRSYAEAIESTVSNSTWQGCDASPSTYQSPAGFALPSTANFTASVSSVRYGDATGQTFTTGCGADYGVQQLTLTVASTDLRASEQLVVVIRDPCVSSCD
jgi:type II secretory pathway pseudopilin PulG